MPPRPPAPDGILVIDKPPGMTSHDVVSAVRRKLGVRRVGHGGTLDPDATGVLVVGVGRATRLLSYAQAAPKSYVATGRLGTVTSTQDASGEILAERDVVVDRADVEEDARSLVGDIDQTPPRVSAVKVRGERLYRKAQRGEEVEREARRVTVYGLRLTSFVPPDFSLEVGCSAGTYVRTLVHDLGSALGCGAHLTTLRRTGSGGFTEDDAVALEDVTPDSLRPPLEVVAHLPRVEVPEETVPLVRNGRRLPLDDDRAHDEGSEVALVSNGRLLAVYRRRGRELKPERVVS